MPARGVNEDPDDDDDAPDIGGIVNPRAAGREAARELDGEESDTDSDTDTGTDTSGRDGPDPADDDPRTGGTATPDDPQGGDRIDPATGEIEDGDSRGSTSGPGGDAPDSSDREDTGGADPADGGSGELEDFESAREVGRQAREERRAEAAADDGVPEFDGTRYFHMGEDARGNETGRPQAEIIEEGGQDGRRIADEGDDPFAPDPGTTGLETDPSQTDPQTAEAVRELRREVGEQVPGVGADETRKYNIRRQGGQLEVVLTDAGLEATAERAEAQAAAESEEFDRGDLEGEVVGGTVTVEATDRALREQALEQAAEETPGAEPGDFRVVVEDSEVQARMREAALRDRVLDQAVAEVPGSDREDFRITVEDGQARAELTDEGLREVAAAGTPGVDQDDLLVVREDGQREVRLANRSAQIPAPTDSPSRHRAALVAPATPDTGASYTQTGPDDEFDRRIGMAPGGNTNEGVLDHAFGSVDEAVGRFLRGSAVIADTRDAENPAERLGPAQRATGYTRLLVRNTLGPGAEQVAFQSPSGSFGGVGDRTAISGSAVAPQALATADVDDLLEPGPRGTLDREVTDSLTRGRGIWTDETEQEIRSRARRSRETFSVGGEAAAVTRDVTGSPEAAGFARGVGLLTGEVAAAPSTAALLADLSVETASNLPRTVEEYGAGRTTEAVAEVGGRATAATVRGAEQHPYRFAGALAGGVAAGTAAGILLERAPGAARSLSIRARGGSVYDLEDVSQPPREVAGLPAYTREAVADQDTAVREFREQTEVGELAEDADAGVAFHARAAEDVAEYGGFGRSFEAPEGGSELPGLFMAADLSPLRLGGATGSGLSMPRFRLPRPRTRTARIAAERDPDVEGVPTDGLEAEGRYLEEQADRGNLYVRGASRTSEQEAIAPPGSRFRATGVRRGIRAELLRDAPERPRLELDPGVRDLLQERIGAGVGTDTRDVFGRPLATDVGEEPLSLRTTRALGRVSPSGATGTETRQVFGRPLASDVDSRPLSLQAAEAVGRARTAGARFPRPGVPLPTFSGGTTTSTREVFGRPLASDVGERPLSLRAAEAVGRARALAEGADPTLPGIGTTDTTTRDVFGRPLASDVGATPISTRAVRAGQRALTRPDLSGLLRRPSLTGGTETTSREVFGRPLALDVDERPLSLRAAEAVGRARALAEGADPSLPGIGTTDTTTRDVFGRPLASDVGATPLSTRVANAGRSVLSRPALSGEDTTSRAVFGRPLASDAGEQPLSLRAAEAVGRARALAANTGGQLPGLGSLPISGETSTTTRDVFGRPLASDVGATPLSLRLAAGSAGVPRPNLRDRFPSVGMITPSPDATSRREVFGAPLAADVDERPLTLRALSSLEDEPTTADEIAGRPLARDVGTTPLSLRALERVKDDATTTSSEVFGRPATVDPGARTVLQTAGEGAALARGRATLRLEIGDVRRRLGVFGVRAEGEVFPGRLYRRADTDADRSRTDTDIDEVSQRELADQVERARREISEAQRDDSVPVAPIPAGTPTARPTTERTRGQPTPGASTNVGVSSGLGTPTTPSTLGGEYVSSAPYSGTNYVSPSYGEPTFSHLSYAPPGSPLSGPPSSPPTAPPGSPPTVPPTAPPGGPPGTPPGVPPGSPSGPPERYGIETDVDEERRRAEFVDSVAFDERFGPNWYQEHVGAVADVGVGGRQAPEQDVLEDEPYVDRASGTLPIAVALAEGEDREAFEAAAAFLSFDAEGSTSQDGDGR